MDEQRKTNTPKMFILAAAEKQGKSLIIRQTNFDLLSIRTKPCSLLVFDNNYYSLVNAHKKLYIKCADRRRQHSMDMDRGGYCGAFEIASTD